MEVEGEVGGMLEELPRLEDWLYSEDDATDDVLRFVEESAEDVCCCGVCNFGYGRIGLGAPLMLAVDGMLVLAICGPMVLDIDATMDV